MVFHRHLRRKSLSISRRNLVTDIFISIVSPLCDYRGIHRNCFQILGSVFELRSVPSASIPPIPTDLTCRIHSHIPRNSKGLAIPSKVVSSFKIPKPSSQLATVVSLSPTPSSSPHRGRPASPDNAVIPTSNESTTRQRKIPPLVAPSSRFFQSRLPIPQPFVYPLRTWITSSVARLNSGRTTLISPRSANPPPSVSYLTTSGMVPSPIFEARSR
jgi:hypothetical protein